MKLTEESKARFLPNLDKPITEDEYLATLASENTGENYGHIMSYDSREAKKHKAFIQTIMQSS